MAFPRRWPTLRPGAPTKACVHVQQVDHSLEACFSLLARATVGPHCVASSSLVPARLQSECGSGQSVLRLLQHPMICHAAYEIRVRTLARRGVQDRASREFRRTERICTENGVQAAACNDARQPLAAPGPFDCDWLRRARSARCNVELVAIAPVSSECGPKRSAAMDKRKRR